ncbi:arabinan endo-1,5-alpha-L-arabinosidase [Paenibacillus mucilaginosus]|uniref:glycoside hydrolase family 43 protein n=1 Tax=Paenibacillus mucilaginosus TaxID=61624 RepID=UPI003D1DE322
MKKPAKKWLVTAALTCAMALTSVIPASAAFWNLTGDIGVHDPSIIKEGSSYYTFSTGTGLQVLRSDNGTNWYRTPQIFLQPLSWWKTYVPNNTNNDVWAPDIHYFNGRYWLYYSISTFGSRTSLIGLTSTASIGSGQWRDDGLVIRTTQEGNDYNAIDPNLTIDANGEPWLSFGSFGSGLKLVKIDKNTMKPTGSLTTIARRTTNGGAIEAPTITYRNGYYYLFASIDYCCRGVDSTYKIVYGRSTSITGPYLDKNGVSMLNNGGTILDSGNDRWKGPGHQDVYNNNIIVRHAYDATDNGAPKMLINDLLWDSSGWPTY